MTKKLKRNSEEKGAALVTAILVMVILMGFAALALSRASSESVINAGDAAESRTFSAAEAALEDSTREFATLIENKLVVTPKDVETLEARAVPFFEDTKYKFSKKITQVGKPKVVTQTKGQFQGLVSLRDEWQIMVTAKEISTGAETEVRRRFFNDRIPLFQFGAFYQDDLEVNDPPYFVFNGRIHTNGNFFTNSGGSDIRYKSKITIAGELIRDRWKNGAALLTGEQSDNVYALNTTDKDAQIPKINGSVTCNSDTGGILKDVTGRNFPYPKCLTNSSWANFSKNFEGNVVTHAKELKLPVNRIGVPLIEMIRRGKNVGDMEKSGNSLIKVVKETKDNGVVAKERFANKEGLRISLADSKEKLPQCANAGNDQCGIRLDGAADGKGGSGSAASGYGYQPKSLRGMSTPYVTTRVNGNRLAVSNRQVWIKIETVKFNSDTEEPEIEDVTEDILSLGVTKPIVDTNGSGANLQIKNVGDSYLYTTDTDSRSIVNLQQFAIEGDFIGSSSNYLRNQTINSKKYNFVVRKKDIKSTVNNIIACNSSNASSNHNYCTDEDGFATAVGSSSSVSDDESAHYKLASFDNGITNSSKARVAIVPFPIQFQDTREGNRSNSTGNLSGGQVFRNGVMSLVDINVGNLRRFFNKEFDSNLPNDTLYAKNHSNQSLKAENVPSNRGWVMYFSDRRGDADFDGRYKMEDVKPGSDDKIDEDINYDNVIDEAGETSESPDADSTVDASYAAVTDHSYYRRGVRLINGEVLPGNYDSASPELTTGFTLASENGIYTWGNYNVQSVSVATGTAATTSDKYSPQGKTAQLTGTTNGNLHIPAALIGDAVTILSNNWNDAKGFAFPNDLTKRTATSTYVRFAMLAGDPITGRSPNEGLNGAQNGGLINFKRFLESWSDDRLNYSGSLVNLFNSFNNNGRHKPNFATYNPPTRDWTFEESFKDPNRLPPGTPFVYYIDFTGFERLNE